MKVFAQIVPHIETCEVVQMAQNIDFDERAVWVGH